MSKIIILKCKHCNKSFRAYQSAKRKFCCNNCKYKYRSANIPICIIKTCTDKNDSKGYCSKHYHHLLRHGRVPEVTQRDKRNIIVQGQIVKIPLGKNAKDGYAIIDSIDLDKVEGFNWALSDKGYVIRQRQISYINKKSKIERISLHKLIYNAPENMLIDHKDRNKLNNRQSNLRVASRQENNWNKSIQSNNTSGYTGVYQRRDTKKWQCYISLYGKRYHIGYFFTAEEAAYVYDQVALQFFGTFARCNIL